MYVDTWLRCFLVIAFFNISTPGVFGNAPDICMTPACIKAADTILSAMNLSADPCTDFYQFACGGFEETQIIPTGQNSIGQFSLVEKKIKNQLRALLENSDPSSDESDARNKVRRYYRSCLDLDKIKERNLPEVRRMVAQIGGFFISTSSNGAWSLNRALALYTQFSSSALFGASVGSDDKNTTQNIIILDQGSLTLGSFSRDFYVNKSLTNDSILVALADTFYKLADLVLPDGEILDRRAIANVVEFEQKMAEVQQSQAELEDHLANYNKVNLTWLQQNLNFLNWTEFFTDMFEPVNIEIQEKEQILMYGMPYFKSLADLIPQYLSTLSGRQTLQNYFVFRAIAHYAGKLGGQFEAINERFLSVLTGKKGSLERWETCLEDINDEIGFPLGAMFVERSFPPEQKRRADKVISNVIASYRNRIEQANWITNETRAKALKKLDAIVFKVAYPDWLLNKTYMDDRYALLNVSDDYVENLFSEFTYNKKWELKKLRETVDRTDWYMAPQIVNAYYDPSTNSIAFLAAILNMPFFYAFDGVPHAVNFGAIGAIAGHEVTHGFDNSGRQYDETGKLVDWWDQASIDEFTNRSKCFIRKFNSYERDGQHVNGEMTLPENLADDGGIKTSYLAYKKWEANLIVNNAFFSTRLPGLHTFSHDQLFFLGFAQTWCRLDTPAIRKFLIAIDSHSPDRFRVMGTLSNSKSFAAAYSCPLGTPMANKNKCDMW